MGDHNKTLSLSLFLATSIAGFLWRCGDGVSVTKQIENEEEPRHDRDKKKAIA